MSSTTRKKITLKLSDGKVEEVDEAVVLESETIKRKMEDGSTDIVIGLPTITVKVFEKVSEFCQKHVDSASSAESKDNLKAWDTEWMDLNYDLIVDLMSAGSDMGINRLSFLGLRTILDEITPEHIKEAFPDGIRVEIVF